MGNNVFGESLEVCSNAPMTGFYRDGCCESGDDDEGTHVVCSIMTQEFLEFSRAMGNDLITPIPQYNFPGLKPGDRWCLCALRWLEAYRAGVAPKVIPEATHEKILEFVSMEDLIKNAYRNPST